METIPDAPWIREAEMYGVPPVDDGLDDAVDYLHDAETALDKAVELLQAAHEEFRDHGENVDFDEEIQQMLLIGNKMREVRRDYSV